MPALSSRRVRCRVTTGTPFLSSPLTDVFSGQNIESVAGNATRFEFGFFDSENNPVDLSSVQSLNLKIQPSQTVRGVLADKTVTALNTSLTAQQWSLNTLSHIAFEFTNAEMNIFTEGARRVLWLVITAITTGGSEVTLAAGNFILHEDNNESVGTPPENPGPALSLEQGDARYLRSVQTSTFPLNGLATFGSGDTEFTVTRTDSSSINLSILLYNPTGPDQTLYLIENGGLGDSGTDVSWGIDLGSDGSGNITSTVSDVVDLINSYVPYYLGEIVANTSDGSGTATPIGETFLSNTSPATRINTIISYYDPESGPARLFVLSSLNPVTHIEIGLTQDLIQKSIPDKQAFIDFLGISAAPAIPIIFGSADPGATINSTVSAVWLLDGAPVTGVAATSLVVPATVAPGQVYSQPGSNTLTVPGVRSVFSGRNQYPNNVYGHATNRSATFRKRVPVFSKVYDLQAIFVNSYVPSTAEVALPDAITVGFRLVHNGVKIPFTFAGAATASIAPGAYRASDIMTATIDPAGSNFAFQDTYVAALTTPTNNTLLWPENYQAYSELGDGETFGQNLTTAIAGNPATVSNGTGNRGFSPVAIIGNQTRGKPFVVIVGDSIATGQGDISGVGQATTYGRDDYGFVKRALDAGTVPYLSLSKPGDRSLAFNTAGSRTLSKQLIALCALNRMIDQYGVNDVQNSDTLANLKSYCQTRWAEARALGIGKIFATTITPKTTSTDWWRTTGSQTMATGFTVGGVRQLFNDWIRSGGDGFQDGFFEAADTIESARNSGLWIASPTPVTGTVSSATSSTATVTGAAWTTGQFQNFLIEITGGTGFPQSSAGLPRTIRSNTADTITLIPGQGFSPALGAGTTFRLYQPSVLDGVHPTSYAHNLMAGSINPASLA